MLLVLRVSLAVLVGIILGTDALHNKSSQSDKTDSVESLATSESSSLHQVLLYASDKPCRAMISSVSAKKDKSVRATLIEPLAMTVDDAAEWVAYAAHLPQYAPLFRDHYVSGHTFPLLVQDDGAPIAELGITTALHRHQLAILMQRAMARRRHVDDARAVITDATCTVLEDEHPHTKFLVRWTSNSTTTTTQFQVQTRDDDDDDAQSSWQHVAFGSDTQHMFLANGSTTARSFRITAWTAAGRSNPRIVVPCPIPSSDEDSHGSWSYMLWLDEALLVTALLYVPLRALIYGDANIVLRLSRTLPPRAPTHVQVDLDAAAACLCVKWTAPVDNGVAITRYCVRWVDDAHRSGSLDVVDASILHADVPGVAYNVVYKVTVDATNAFGLTTSSPESTFMAFEPHHLSLPLPPVLTTHCAPSAAAARNVCALCVDEATTTNATTPSWTRRRPSVVHYCSVCDDLCCPRHTKHTNHFDFMACPAVGGHCVCVRCFEAPRARLL
ncbi:Aste57867_18895 [Aphanomyces stellatus]|uniref:Aste57867_18895 protein n=1 Tax=Aphanomyces stellatus TaxID=120398 RepID=A0A485LFI4_9STRA|nr:hypothetical protein As57867_018831 [Aphanomyces stellatus]VFT95627.1 Aste57867_18895 [Aphanomyces stellatus]